MSIVDFRGQGPPADIGTFVSPASVIVYQHTFSGVTYTCAARFGDRGWTLVSHLPTTAANNLIVLQAAHNALPVGEGEVCINLPFTAASGILVVTRSYFSLICNVQGGAAIEEIQFDNNADNITRCTLTGVSLNMLEFYSRNSHYITHVHIIDSVITANGTVTGEGIHFRGDGTGEIHNIYFDNDYFYDGGQSARGGFISISFKHGGSGQIFFDDCTYSADHAGNTVFLCFEAGGAMGPPIFINNLNFVEKDRGASVRVIQVGNEAAGVAPLTGGRVIVTNSFFELWDSTDIVEVLASAANQTKYFMFTNNNFDGADGTHYLLDIDNNNRYLDIAFKHNIFSGSGWNLTDTFANPEGSDYVRIKIRDNQMSRNIYAGVIATPFNNAGAGWQIMGLGGTGAPAASITYTALGGEFLVTSTGGTGVSITITDDGGNTVCSGLVTLTGFLMPEGWNINFGAFSVGPTVVVAMLP